MPQLDITSFFSQIFYTFIFLFLKDSKLFKNFILFFNDLNLPKFSLTFLENIEKVNTNLIFNIEKNRWDYIHTIILKKENI